MTEFKNVEQEVRRFRMRLAAAAAFVLFAFGLLGARLVYLQIYRHDELSTQAENNRITVVPIVPNRGLILDRNGVVLANNYSAYTLEITPTKVDDSLEATIDSLASVIEIQPRDKKRFKRLMEENKSFESLPIRTKLTDDEVARFTAQRFRFPGVDIKARLFRNYPLGDVGSHLIGYIGRINEAEKAKIDDTDDDSNYRGTQYIGKLGVEQSYEAELHGTTGFEEMETSASGHPVRRLDSKPATPGNALVMSIDIKLQALVESLYGDRRGALVAIDPRNGEVLAFVSKPNFDPNLFVDGIDQENWKALNESPDKPLLNRALRGTYSPGSTYKPFMALAALTLGKRNPAQAISDPGYYYFGGHKFRDDKEGGHGSVDMYKSIVASCDTYYYQLAADLGVDAIHDFMAPLGFGQTTGIDVPGELHGVLPSTQWKRTAYRKKEAQRWYAGETISLGIGQGYNSFTMLQLADAMSTLAAGGKRWKPHVVKVIENTGTRAQQRSVGEALPPMNWKPQDVAFIHRALAGVIQDPSGTASKVFVNSGYTAGGKTGTAQVIGVAADAKYNAKTIDERHRDNALFIAFAPVDQPRIALALIVENGGWGAGAAAPIARRVLDYVLNGQYPSEEDIAATRLGQSVAPTGTPRPADSVTLPGVTIDGAAAALLAPSTPPAGTPAEPPASAVVVAAVTAAPPAPAASSLAQSPSRPSTPAQAKVPVPVPVPVPVQAQVQTQTRSQKPTPSPSSTPSPSPAPAPAPAPTPAVASLPPPPAVKAAATDRPASSAEQVALENLFRDKEPMSAVFDRPSPWQRIRPIFTGFDIPLLLAMLLLGVAGLVTMYSAGFDSGTRFPDHARNMLLAVGVLFVVAQVPPQTLMKVAVPLYGLGVALLVAVAVIGVTKKGATRWLNVGVVIQPSEILKIATPLMLAWWFQRREGQAQAADFVIALMILAVPVGLIVKQPDLGTAILVLSAGLYVIFFAGLSWRLILPVLIVGAIAITAIVLTEDRICQPDLKWPMMRDYQKNRICTLLDPTTDPLGKGFHIIQGMIAIGSGGVQGKGFMKGTQTHLEFIPERTTDFIFAAFSEEFGLVGCASLVAGFIFLIFRGLMIAADAPTVFTRLLAGAITLSFFTYAFVNMGMVSGILPVVGVPLPFISYGGTAMVTLGMGLGMLMSIAKSRRLIQS